MGSMIMYPKQPLCDLPPEYDNAHPLALAYVDLSEEMVSRLGVIAHKFFNEFGWQQVEEHAYLLESGKLLLVVDFKTQQEKHYLEIPQEHWKLNCVAVV